MKKILILAMLMALASCGKTESTSSVPARDGVFIHITAAYENAHRVLMPMKMAVMMAKDKDVLVYLDIEAVKLTQTNSKDVQMEGFDSFRTYLKQLSDMKVGVYACPTCLKVAKLNPDALIEGIKVAEKDRFFDFTKGRIITLDY